MICICHDTFILCTQQAKSIEEHHIGIFLNYAFIDPNNIFVYHIFDSYCLLSLFLLFLISFCNATEPDHMADVFMY